MKGRGRLKARVSQNPGGWAVFLEEPENRQRVEPDGHSHQSPRGEPGPGSQRRQRQRPSKSVAPVPRAHLRDSAWPGREPKRTSGIYMCGVSGASGLGEKAGGGPGSRARADPVLKARRAHQPARGGWRRRGCRPPSGTLAGSAAIMPQSLSGAGDKAQTKTLAQCRRAG